MSISRFFVRIKTGKHEHAGTNDRMFLGIFGKSGGREFGIDNADLDVNDFERGDNVTYLFGSHFQWSSAEAHLVATAVDAYASAEGSGDWNDPKLMPLAFGEIEYVYIRKAGARQSDDDDAFQLEEAEARFWDLVTGQTQTFRFDPPNPVWLANESGLQVWLVKERG